MTVKKYNDKMLNGLWFNMIQLNGHFPFRKEPTGELTSILHIHNYNPQFIIIIIIIESYHQIILLSDLFIYNI